MNKPVIAIVTNASWNIYNFRISLIRHFKKNGFSVIGICPDDGYLDKIKKECDQVYALKEMSRKGTNPLQDLKLVTELKKAYKAYKVDVALHFTIKPNIYGSIAAKQATIPSIAVVTGLGYTFLSSGFASKAAKVLYKKAFKKNSYTVFQNPDDFNLFKKLNLVKQEKAKVIYGSGIDVDVFTPVNSNTNEVFNFLFIGRLLYDKGIVELLDAFSALKTKDATLTVIGGIDKNNPSALVQEDIDRYTHTNKNITFCGHVNNPKQYIEEAHCVVLPSYREGLPRVMLEALALAKPVISTDVPGCRETIVEGKNGFLIEVKNSIALQEAMQNMMELNANKRQEMGNFGRTLAEEKFSTKVINQDFLTLVNSII